MTTNYTADQLVFLREGYKLMHISDLTVAFNRYFRLGKSEGQINSALKNHKIVSGRGTSSSNASRILNLEQKYFVQELYPVMTRRELLNALNETYKLTLSLQQLISFLKNHNIISGRTGFYEKGLVPWNTGTKGVMKPNTGSFKKGTVPPNKNPIGHERICSKDGYVLIKVAGKNPRTGFEGQYRHKHVVVWEKNYGPVPKGFVVTFRDGDKTNVELENLELMDRNLLCRMNFEQVNKLPKELIPTMKNVVKLKVQIHKRSKGL